MTPSNDIRYGAIFVTLCPLSLAFMGYAVKLSDEYSVATVLLARFGVSALIYSIWLVVNGYAFTEIRPSKHLLRTVLGFSSVACLFGSISLIPLSTALCLSYTVPMFSYIISIAVGTIKPDRRFVFIAGAVGGIALIVQPSADVGVVGALLGLSSALFGALALFEIKRITKTEGAESILFMYFFYSTALLLLYAATVENGLSGNFLTDDDATILVAVGIFGFLYQLSLVGALKTMSVAAVSLAMLLAVAIGYTLDVALLDSQISVSALIGTTVLALCIAAYSRAS